MAKPISTKLTKEQLCTLIDRIEQSKLDKTDMALLSDIVCSMKLFSQALTNKNTTIHRVRQIFGFEGEQTTALPLKSDDKNSKLNPSLTSDHGQIN